MRPRRLSAPLDLPMEQITALRGLNNQMNKALQTQSLFPDFTPSSNYDSAPMSNWSHFKRPRRFWEYLIFTVSLITPIEISFVLLFDRKITPVEYSVFFIVDIIQLLDNYVTLKTPFIKNGILVDEKLEIIKHYGIFSFILHVLASLPLGWIGVIKGDIKIYGYLSINRLFRLHQAWNSYRMINDSQTYQGIISKIYPHIMMFFFCVHCFTCVYYLIATIDGIDNSWIAGFVANGFTTTQQYVVSLYFVLTTIFTIGFGDIHPVTTTERIICILFAIVGVLFNGLIISKMVMIIRDPQKANFAKQAATVHEFLVEKGIDPTYIRHVRHFYQNRWNNTHGSPSWNEIFKDLPTSIRSAVTLEFCEKAFSKIQLFHGLRERYLLVIIDSMSSFSYCPGECIYHQGDLTTDLLIFKSGIIQIHVNGEILATSETSSNYIDCEEEFIFNEPRKKTVIAISFVEGWKIEREHFVAILASNTHLRQIAFMNVKHQFHVKVQEKNLTEDKLWGVVNEPFDINDEESEHVIPSEDDFLYVDDEKDQESI
ncbi:hypothetical protein M9Y10_004729 [Tritrichomonas musculus]|uniref:Cyclic nucleotide-binding domain-containing protein n=1 Tax=Tritrichomonas musculus TaxID=1915356 RepID=A0ABR2JJD6_9EUKA